MRKNPTLLKDEQIKYIKGYDRLYSITTKGRVWSWGNNKNISPGWIKPKAVTGGYLSVGLYKGGKRKEHKVHRLVAIAFISNNEEKPYVNHKDFNVQNNNVDNLEWCTPKENTTYSVERGRWNNMVNNKTWEKGAKIANKKETWRKAVQVAKEKSAWIKGNARCKELKTYKIAQKFAKEANKKKVKLFFNDKLIKIFPSIKEAANFAELNGMASANTLKAFKKSRSCRLELVEKMAV